MNGSIADNTSNAESATGDVYISSSNIEAQCDHNHGVEVRAVPAQSCKENGGTPPPSPEQVYLTIYKRTYYLLVN